MTSNIDERVVEMRFDNQQFESGVGTTMKTLNGLKQGLQFDESVKSLSSLEKAGRSFSLGGIADGVNALVDRFSNLGIVGITVLQNLTNSALNAGKRVISALTIDPVKMGFDEYETKMNAIQTIMTNTAGTGTTMADVTKSLNELNTYADQTIYDFAEMTRNIGTFTAAGIDLKTSTEAIKGIANLAAGSGSNAQQASTAMYQLSQAMASGTVKLQDWNSVVNAGMGGKLFQHALEKTAKELGHGRDMGVSFRESLQKGWITTEVLTKTLQKFASDKSLLQAATQVKTFTQLFDTMKESVQSGWAQTWEAIIGNKDEAAGVLTEINNIFGNIVGASAKARNAMLEFWKANGGRYALIEALFNAFKGLQEILVPIGQAFKEIFPPMTGKRLVEITESLRDLTRNFKVSDETAANIKNTFKGLFAILDVGKQAFSALAGGMFEVVKSIIPIGGGFLSITANIGKFLVGIDQAIKKSGIFKVVIESLVKGIKIVADGVKMAVALVVGAVNSFGNVDLSGLDAFSEKVAKSFDPFKTLGDFIKNTFSKMLNILKGFTPIFYGVANTLGKAFEAIKNNIMKSIDNDGGFSIISGSLFATLLLGVKNLVKSLKDISGTAGGFVENIKGILDGVRGSLESYQQSIKAGTLLKIAVSIGILAASLMTLSTIDPKKLGTALGAMTTMFVELFGSMAVFQKLMGTTGFIAMGKITLAMIGLSTAVLVLSAAVKRLASLDVDGLVKGLIGIASLSLILVKTTQAMSMGSKGLIKASVGFIIFGAAINILSMAVEKFAKLNPNDLMKGLVGVGVMCAELALFMKVSNFSGMGVIKSVGLIALAVSISILATSVKKFSSINTNSLIKGLSGVAVLLAEVALFTRVTADAKKVAATATGMILLGASILIFASAIQKMGSLSIEQIGKGLLAMGGALTIITTALKLMPKNILLQSTALVVMSVAITGLAHSLNNMGGMSWDEIAKGLVALGGALGIISIAMIAMKTALPGAAALLVISGALTILTPCLKALGAMSFTEIGAGLLALAGAFTVIGVAGALLSPLVPSILALSAAIALFGVGCAAVGVGVLAFSTGLTALAVSGTAAGVAIVAIITGIVGLIPFTLKTLAKGLVDFAKILGEGAPTIFDAMLKILNGILDVIITCSPKIATAIVTLVASLLDVLVKAVPNMVNAGMQLILGILKGVADNIKQVVAAGIEVILQFIAGVVSKIPAIVDAAFKIVISFIDGLAQAIKKNHNALTNAIGNLIKAIGEAIGALLPKVVEVGGSIVTSLAKGIGGAIGEFFTAGKNVVLGFIDGIKSYLPGAKKVATELGTTVDQATKKELEIHSPSKKGQSNGEQYVNGHVVGIKNSTPKAVAAAKDMAKKVIDSSKSTLDKTTSYQTYGKSIVDQLIKSDKEASKAGATTKKEVADNEEARTKDKKASDEALKKKKEALSKYQEAQKKAYDTDIQLIEDKKYYNQLSLVQELAAYKTLQKKYKEGSDERKKLDKEVYRVQKELTQKAIDDQSKAFDKKVNAIDDKVYYGKMNSTQELAAWKKILDDTTLTAEEREKAKKEIYKLQLQVNSDAKDKIQKSYDADRQTYIEDKKNYDQLSLGQELATLEVLRDKYKSNADIRKQLDLEVYQKKQEITAKMKEVDDNYAENCQQVNDKLKSDIQSVNDAYDSAVKSRTDALYATSGLFDKVESRDPVSGTGLITNLKGQVKEFEEWQKTLAELGKKGIDQGLMDEFQQMGPKTLGEIQALNQLTDKDLTTYVELWRTKYADAKTQALLELAPLKTATTTQIEALKSQAEYDLGQYKQTWITATDAIKAGVIQEFDGLMAYIPKDINNTKPLITNAFDNISTAVKNLFTSSKWNSTGTNIVLGMVAGVKSMATKLADESAKTAALALAAAKKKLGIKSPSKEFAKVGMYSVLGMVDGLKSYSGLLTTAGSNVGTVAVDSLKGAVSNISNVISNGMDTQPTIRPVLDMTDVNNGLTSVFGNTQTLNVDGVVDKASSINSRNGSIISSDSTSNQTNNVSAPIQIVYQPTVRNDSDLKKIDKGLKTLVDKYSYAKGVPVL